MEYILLTVLELYVVTTFLALAYDLVHRINIEVSLLRMGYDVEFPPWLRIDARLFIPVYNVFSTVMWIIRYDERMDALVGELEADNGEG